MQEKCSSSMFSEGWILFVILVFHPRFSQSQNGSSLRWNATVCTCVNVQRHDMTWPPRIILQHCGCKDPEDCDAGQRFKSPNEEDNNGCTWAHIETALLLLSFNFLTSWLLQSCERTGRSNVLWQNSSKMEDNSSSVGGWVVIYTLAFPFLVCRPAVVTSGITGCHSQKYVPYTLIDIGTILVRF